MMSHPHRYGLGLALLVVLLALPAGLAQGREIHVAPTGAAQGDGTLTKPLDIVTALSSTSPAQPGDTIILAGGVYEGAMNDLERVPFDLAVSGSKDKPIVVMPAKGQWAHLNGCVSLTSSYTHYIGLDIGDLKWDPTMKAHKTATALNAVGGAGAKVINCNIFGGAMGTGLWQTATELEVYGTLVHDFGTLSDQGGRGHGHAFYTQNAQGTKTIARCIAYRGCGWNLHVYTQSGQIIGYDIVENIFYIAGAYKSGQTMDNFLVAGYPAADRIRMIGNIGYQPSTAEGWRPNARMSSFKLVTNGAGEVRDNYFAGAVYGLSLGDWKNLTVTGNTIWAQQYFLEINSAPTGSGMGDNPTARPDLAGYRVDNNTYFVNNQAKPFIYGRHEKPQADDLLDLAAWQKLGLDKNSKVLEGRSGKPAGNKVWVFPNQYQPGRANIAAFNWDGVDQIEADLSSALAKGQKYAIYNCLDIHQTIALAKPILRGEYDGKPVVLPLRKDPISPDFDAFLVLPQ